MESSGEKAVGLARTASRRSVLRALGVLVAQAAAWRVGLVSSPDVFEWAVGMAAAAGAFYFVFCAMAALDDLSVLRTVIATGGGDCYLSNTWSYRWQRRLGDAVFYLLVFVGGLSVAAIAAWLMLRV